MLATTVPAASIFIGRGFLDHIGTFADLQQASKLT